MVEVFRTDVKDLRQAEMLLQQIHQTFDQFHANFDLDDCDNILRVESPSKEIPTSLLINILNAAGYKAEILS
jgi:hypothetical protein